MKTTMTPTSSPAWSLIETLQPMKTRLTILRFLIILCGVLAAPAVFGQTVFTWTNSAGGDLGTAANWDPNGVPNPRGTGANNGVIADVLLFDGRTAGPLSVSYNALGNLGRLFGGARDCGH